MIGEQTITLTPESAREALQDYMNKHLLPGSHIVVKKWTPKQSYVENQAVHMIDAVFEQMPLKVEPPTLPQDER